MWNSPAEFFAMGGYALYVWSSFGACALVMLIEPLVIRTRYKAVLHRVKQERLAEQFDKEGSQ
jgi:heme exporter protein D